MSESDQYIFDRAIESKEEPQAITSEQKYYLDLNDQNAHNYKNQQLIFDMPSAALVDGQTVLEDSILRVPYQVTATSTVDFGDDAIVKDMVMLKGNATSIVDSMQIMLDNQVIRTFSSHSEVPAYFKLISSMSEDYKPVAESIVNQNLDTGVGTYTAAMGEHLVDNTAFAQKGARISDSADASGFQDLVNMTNKSKSHYVRSTARKLTWNYLLEIPLKHLDELFENKIPPSRGLYLKINLQIHAGTCTFVSTAKDITAASSVTTYGTLPFMVNPDAINAATHGVLAAAGAGTVKVEGGILRNSAAAANNPLLGTCQMHLAIYKPRLAEEQRLLQRKPVDINYNQVMYQTHRNVKPNTSFSFQISSSSSRPSHLLIHTRLSDVINMSESVRDADFDNTTNAVPTGTMASAFSSSPCTTKPYSSLTQFQITVGGMPLFVRGALNVDYDFYADNFRSFNSLNGGKDVQDCSGLISKEMWEKNYGYIVIDLKKYEQFANWVAPKDISITATNNSPNQCDYMFFLAEQRDIKLDTATGKILI